MKRTPLFENHVAAGAKLMDFAGWNMPLQYSSVIDEYHAVRRAAGLFDVSHMGRVYVSGTGATPFLQRVTTNDVAKVQPLQSQYSMVCNERGGIKDDIFLYRIKPDEFLLCINASNREKLVDWLQAQAKDQPDLTISDRTREVAQLALQGPIAKSLLIDLGAAGVTSLGPRHCVDVSISGMDVLITRTGYTGELGYELYVPAYCASDLWQKLLAKGKSTGLKPAALGSRDLLRLDMAYLLYGNDISEETTPLEANAAWLVSFDKGDFIGRAALLQQRNNGVSRKLTAFELSEKGVPRHGFKVIDGNAQEIGEVTSGNLSPVLQKGIGLAYVPPAYSAEGATFAIDIRGKRVPAVVVKPPFYKRKKD